MANVRVDVQRWTAKRRVALVLSIVRGETSVAEAARDHGLTVAEIEDWQVRAEHSLCEGLADTLTLQRLGFSGALYRTLRSTNMIENLNGLVGHFTRNVRRCGATAEARPLGRCGHRGDPGTLAQLRGHRDLAALVRALDRVTVDRRKEVA